MKIGKATLFFIAILLVLFLLFEIFPIIWIFLNSIKPNFDINSVPLKIFDFKPVFQNYITAAVQSQFLTKILNSAIIAIPSVIISLFFGTMAAYGIVRLKVGGSTLLMAVITTRMLPTIVLILPLFVIFKNLGLSSTHLGLIFIYTTFLLSFVIWQMSSFLKGIPIEIEEAAIIDGCNKWQIFFKIILPLSKAGLIAVGIFCFLGAWNEYLFASILGGTKVTTAPVAITHTIYGGVERGLSWGIMSSASIITLAPAFLLILIIQKQMVEGLTMGAVKG